MPELVPSSLSETQRHRYARHVLLPEVGHAGQERLLAGAVRLVGAGRAAEEAAIYLAAAGVGRLVLEATLVASIGARISALNPDVDVVVEAPDALAIEALGERRADGAMAALRALMTLLGLTA